MVRRKLVVLLVILCASGAELTHRDLATNKKNKMNVVGEIIDDLNDNVRLLDLHPVNDEHFGKQHKSTEGRVSSTTNELNKDGALIWMWRNDDSLAPDGVMKSLENEHIITTRSQMENTSGDFYSSPEIGTIKVVTKCKDKPHKRGERHKNSARHTTEGTAEVFTGATTSELQQNLVEDITATSSSGVNEASARHGETASTIKRPLRGKRRTKSHLNTKEDTESTSTAHEERRTKSIQYHHHDRVTLSPEIGWDRSRNLVRDEFAQVITRRGNVIGVTRVPCTCSHNEDVEKQISSKNTSRCLKFMVQPGIRATTARHYSEDNERHEFCDTDGNVTDRTSLNNTTASEEYDSPQNVNHLTTPFVPAASNEPEQYDSEGEYAVLSDDQSDSGKTTCEWNSVNPSTDVNPNRPSPNKYRKLSTAKDQYDYVINYDDLDRNPHRGSQSDRADVVPVEGILQAIISTRERMLKSKQKNTSRSHKTAPNIAEQHLLK